MFVIEVELLHERTEELVIGTDFNLHSRTGRIWIHSSRTPKYLKPYTRTLDNSLKCADVEKNLTNSGAAYCGYLKGEDSKKKPLRFRYT